MHREQIAESILGLVTTRERAAATAGDLFEQAGALGGFWFWSSVLRTTFALSWSSFTDEPVKLLWLGFRGSLLGGLLSSLAQILAVAASLVFFAGVVPHYPLPGGPFNPSMPGWVPRTYYALIFGSSLLSMFYVGRGVARRAPGREMAALITFIAVQYPVGALLSVIVMDGLGSQVPAYAIPVCIALNVAGMAAKLAGGVQVRRKAIA